MCDHTTVNTAPERQWVNVYEVSLCYGGPEEGGWYYDIGTPLASVPFQNYTERSEIEAHIRRMYPDIGKKSMRHLSSGPSDIELSIEDHMAEAYPTTRPHYE